MTDPMSHFENARRALDQAELTPPLPNSYLPPRGPKGKKTIITTIVTAVLALVQVILDQWL